MSREDESMRAYQNFLVYEYKLKQMKMEIQIREVIIEREKQNRYKTVRVAKDASVADSSAGQLSAGAAASSGTAAGTPNKDTAVIAPAGSSVKFSIEKDKDSPER